MKIYVAGKFEEKKTVKLVQSKLIEAGHVITHDWTTEDTTGLPPDKVDQYLRDCARGDMYGVLSADALVVLNHPQANGTMVEMGMALAANIPVFVLNAHLRDNIFFHLEDNVQLVNHIDELVACLQTLEKFGR